MKEQKEALFMKHRVKPYRPSSRMEDIPTTMNVMRKE